MNRSLARALGALSLLAIAAACSSGGTTTTDPPLRPAESFSRMDARGDALANAFANQSVRIDPRDLPRSGVARYEGYADIAPRNSGTILGQMNMDVNFGSNAVSGEIVNMRTARSNLNGRITMRNGEINRNAGTRFATFTLDLGGNVVTQSGNNQVRGDLDGQFARTRTQQLVGGAGNGSLSRNSERIPFDIQIVGER